LTQTHKTKTTGDPPVCLAYIYSSRNWQWHCGNWEAAECSEPSGEHPTADTGCPKTLLLSSVPALSGAMGSMVLTHSR